MSRKGHNKGQRWIRVLKCWKKGIKREVLQITYEFTELLWHARRDSKTFLFVLSRFNLVFSGSTPLFQGLFAPYPCPFMFPYFFSIREKIRETFFSSELALCLSRK